MQSDKSSDDTHVIEWRIQNFSSCVMGPGEKLECPVSKAGNFYNSRWTLWIYPRGKDHPNVLGIFLKREDEKYGPQSLHVDFEFSLLTFDGAQMFIKRASEEFKRGTSYGFPRLVELKEIHCRKEFLLQSDALKLRCKLRLLPPKKKHTSQHLYVTDFPTEMIPANLTLRNFRKHSKQNPKTFNIKQSSEVITVSVSMNKDKDSKKKIPEGADGSGTSESFLHIVIAKLKMNYALHISCFVKVLNKNREVAVGKEVSHLFPKTDDKEEWILPHFIDTNTLGDDCIDEDDTLHLQFDFTICNSPPLSQQIADLTPMKLKKDPKETTLMKDFTNLHQTRKFSDVTLRVEDETFPAHKSILAARSPRFEQIFETTDRNNHIEEIGDVDKHTMTRMLKFIYTDRLDDMDAENYLLLYSAAWKYQIPSLQLKCVRFLKKKLTVETVYKTLFVAEESENSDLKMIAIDFLLEHYQHVLLTPEWQAFTVKHAELSNQILRHIRLKKQLQIKDDEE